MDWDDYRFFRAVAGAGSVRGAAAALAVNPSTVTRRLEQLETRLGMKLFTRSPQGLAITTDAAAVLADIDDVEERLTAIERRLGSRDGDIAGSLRVGLSEVFSFNGLFAHIAAFSRVHPEVRFSFLNIEPPAGIGAGLLDVALCLTAQPPGAMVGRRLGRMTMAGFAEAAYLREGEAPAQPGAAGWIEGPFERQHGVGFRDRHFAQLAVGSTCETLAQQIAAARAQLGVTLLPCPIGDSDPRLERAGSAVEEQDIWLLYPPDLRGVARLQALCAWLDQVFADHAGPLTGT